MPEGALYAGEELRVAAGFPALTCLRPGRPDRPLVVFVTGGGVLARIAYGHEGAPPADFLAHWLVAAGYSFLGVSYPLGNAVFAQTYPDFTVQDWAAQTAELTETAIEAHGLERRVLVLGWSMAGRIAGPLQRRMQERGLALELFVAMAATPAVPGLLPVLHQLRPAASGLADAGGSFVAWLQRCLQAQNALAGRVLIPDQRFLTEYIGDYPVNLAATALRYRAGRFVLDPQADEADTGVWDYPGFPALAVLTHNSSIDARHALTDRANWSLHLTQSLAARQLWRAADDLTKLSRAEFARLLDRVGSAPDLLSMRVQGSHLFFVGEAGAKATVDALETLRERASALDASLAQLLGRAEP